ncbi:MAG TPA: hypothetical protein PK379_07185 [Candidatus Hydrogenedentes bacterium]|nr:hypothetical protein [Candidatus Hydrogenedentota bacterium]
MTKVKLALAGLLLAGMLGVAVVLGILVARWSVPDDLPQAPGSVPVAESGTTPAGGKPVVEANPDAPLLCLNIPGFSAETWPIAAEEIRLAAAAGVHQYLLPVSLRWEGAPEPPDPVERVNQVIVLDPEATFLLTVDVNPPPEWLSANPAEAMVGTADPLALPSAASQAWINAAKDGLTALLGAVEGSAVSSRILGYALCGLLDHQWRLPAGFDRSEVNRQGFRDWLVRQYQTETRVAQVWHMPEFDVSSVSIPAPPGPGPDEGVFMVFPQDRPLSDFLRYSSDSVADALAALVAHTRAVSLIAPLILAPYGYTLEASDAASGHFALGALLHSDLSGIIAPLAQGDRGLGGAGHLAAPAQSLTDRGMRYVVVDDIRSGMERNAETGAFERDKGIRLEDVLDVRRRNFAQALVYGFGLTWSDPLARGWLVDPDQWQELGRLAGIYQRVRPRTEPPPAEPLPGVTLVVSERAAFVTRAGTSLYARTVAAARDAVYRSGAPARTVLLQDLFEDVNAPTPVYLFANAFRLTQSERRALRARLAREGACAIWLYAPGYFDEQGSAVAGITEITGIRVVDAGPGGTAARYVLDGTYLKRDATWGDVTPWAPRFAVEDPDADALAHYVDGGKVCVAVKPQPDGWTSVLIVTPEITVSLLAELLSILEQPMLVQAEDGTSFDTVFAAGDLLAIHAGASGRRIVNLGRFADTRDLLDDAFSWSRKDSFPLQVRLGETRLLQSREEAAGQP